MRNTNYVISGGKLIFQKFELSLSCSTYSRKLKISEIKFRTSDKKRGKVLEKSSGKLIFAISRYKTNTSRAVLS